LTELEECIRKGLIRKIPPSQEQAYLSMEKAWEMLGEAQANLEESRYNSAVLVGYVAALNAAKALLSRDGFREKSHYCIARFLEVHYCEVLGSGMLHMFDTYREARHETQYSATHNSNESEAKEFIRFTEEFLEKISGLIGD
jgi:uncharacterized protein (UPF0332 family)